MDLGLKTMQLIILLGVWLCVFFGGAGVDIGLGKLGIFFLFGIKFL